MSRKIAIVGSGHTVLTAAIELASHYNNNICVLHDVVDRKFTDLREPEPFLITARHELVEPPIAIKEPMINYKKQDKSFLKNRKKRKKKKRR